MLRGRPSGLPSRRGGTSALLWLNQDELAELIGEVRSAIVSKMNNKPSPDRSLYLLSPILFPIEERPQHGTDQ
jgi:hypothetical protein